MTTEFLPVFFKIVDSRQSWPYETFLKYDRTTFLIPKKYEAALHTYFTFVISIMLFMLFFSCSYSQSENIQNHTRYAFHWQKAPEILPIYHYEFEQNILYEQNTEIGSMTILFCLQQYDFRLQHARQIKRNDQKCTSYGKYRNNPKPAIHGSLLSQTFFLKYYFFKDIISWLKYLLTEYVSDIWGLGNGTL